jgi:hypothetical protein
MSLLQGLRNSAYYVASASESRTNEVVWGDVVGGTASTMLVLYSNTPGYERNLAFLSQWGQRAKLLLFGKATPQSPLEQQFSEWLRHDWIAGACAHVFPRQQMGFSVFLHAFEQNVEMMQGANPWDHNSTLVQLDCRHTNIRIAGRLPPTQVALQRLSELHQRGGQPIAAAVVQAGPLLLQNSGMSGATVVVFSFDPRIEPATLKSTAEMLAGGKWGEMTDERFEPGADLLQASDVQWQHCRRVRIPARSSAELEYYVADLWIPREYLLDGYLSPRQPRILPCLATAGDQGAIELLPYDRITQFWPAGAMVHFLPRG